MISGVFRRALRSMSPDRITHDIKLAADRESNAVVLPASQALRPYPRERIRPLTTSNHDNGLSER
ncbi:protein of unknown function [Shinella sp. WSC3-e]|nr:hypothetical protein SHINE37_42919 [Rhizobiaceae bacterium]CAK7257483.1 protein of unknown function [Shinella sp. WSC3-e]